MLVSIVHAPLSFSFSKTSKTSSFLFLFSSVLITPSESIRLAIFISCCASLFCARIIPSTKTLLLPSLLTSFHFLILRILLPFGSRQTVLPSPGIPPLSIHDTNSNSFFAVLFTREPSPVSIPLASFLAKSNISDAEIPKQFAPELSVNWLAAGVPGGHLNFPFSSTSIPNAEAALAIRERPRCPMVLPGSRFSS